MHIGTGPCIPCQHSTAFPTRRLPTLLVDLLLSPRRSTIPLSKPRLSVTGKIGSARSTRPAAHAASAARETRTAPLAGTRKRPATDVSICPTATNAFVISMSMDSICCSPCQKKNKQSERADARKTKNKKACSTQRNFRLISLPRKRFWTAAVLHKACIPCAVPRSILDRRAINTNTSQIANAKSFNLQSAHNVWNSGPKPLPSQCITFRTEIKTRPK